MTTFCIPQLFEMQYLHMTYELEQIMTRYYLITLLVNFCLWIGGQIIALYDFEKWY